MNGNGCLEKLEFEEMLSKIGVFLSTQELRIVFENFDVNKDGSISFLELVRNLKVSNCHDSNLNGRKINCWYRMTCQQTDAQLLLKHGNKFLSERPA